MNKLARVGIAAVAVGGALMMAAPGMAFADTVTTTTYPATSSTAVSFQGDIAGGAVSQNQYGGSGTANMAEGATFNVGQTQATSMGTSLSASGDYASGSSFTNYNLGTGNSYTKADSINQNSSATNLNQQSLSGSLNQNMNFMGGDDSMGGNNASQSQSAMGGTVAGSFWTNLWSKTASSAQTNHE